MVFCLHTTTIVQLVAHRHFTPFLLCLSCPAMGVNACAFAPRLDVILRFGGWTFIFTSSILKPMKRTSRWIGIVGVFILGGIFNNAQADDRSVAWGIAHQSLLKNIISVSNPVAALGK